MPKYTVSDQGTEFGEEYLEWCDDHDVGARIGAVGRHGSIAVIERFIRSMKDECFRRTIVPLGLRRFRDELSSYVVWFNQQRPHTALGGRTPEER